CKMAFNALGMHGGAAVVSSQDPKPLTFAGDRIALDLGDLGANHVRLPWPAGTVDRVKTCRIRTEGGRSDGDDTPAFGGMHRFTHRYVMVGILGPNFSGTGADCFGLHVPHVGHGVDETCARFTRFTRCEGSGVAAHIRLAARSAM